MTIEECLKKMEEYPEMFDFSKQNYPDVKGYLQKKFDCKFIPEDLLLFLQNVDGMRSGNLTIFSILNKDKSFAPLTFEDYANENMTRDYLNRMKIKTRDKLFFIGTDSQGGRYAIRTNKEDNFIYYFSIYRPKMLIKFSSFTDLLSEQIGRLLMGR